MSSFQVTDNPCFIVGGGSSLFEYLPDPLILPPEHTILTNKAYELIPDAFACHFCDDIFYWENKKQIQEYKGKLSTCGRQYKKDYNKFGIRMYNQSKKIPLSIKENTLAGGNSGHQAINLGYHFGYRTFVLLGFDMHSTGKTHWHKGHKRETLTSLYQSDMIPNMIKLSEVQGEFGIKIYNANKNSALKCFEFVELEDFV